MSSSVKVWTSERLSLSEEGKASGLDSVVIVLAEVSLHFAPQTSQVNVVFCRPLLLSSRLPQSVQKTRAPMADILK